MVQLARLLAIDDIERLLAIDDIETSQGANQIRSMKHPGETR
jgi:hypothetical protein